MAIVFLSNKELVRRAIAESVPRDWFATLDVQLQDEIVAIIKRQWPTPGVPRRVVAVPFQQAGPEISPAVIEAMLAPKAKVLLNFIAHLQAAMRLETAFGVDIDSWAWQFYGDLVLRKDNEQDDDFKDRIRCLLHNITTGEEFFFLPSPTEKGVKAWMACFGYDVTVTGTTPVGTLTSGFFWAAQSVLPPNGPSPIMHQPTGWSHAPLGSITMGWNGASVAVTIPGGTTLENQIAISLLRRARVFGIQIQIAFV